MERREFCAWLPELEATFPVADWKVDGIRIWPLVRTEVYASNFNVIVRGGSLEGGYCTAAGNALKGLTRWLVASMRDSKHNQRPSERADAVFLANSSGRQPKIGGACLNPLLYPYVDLVRALGGRTTVLETVPFGVYNTPRATPSAWIQHEVTVTRALSLFPREVPAVALPHYDDFQAAIRNSGLRSRYGDRSVLIRDAWFVQALSRKFTRWLHGSRPKVCFVTNYGLREMAFCLAAARFGISCVEIQHGTQGPTHPMYARWREPEAGSWWELRPNVFWNWDEGSAENIRSWGVASVEALVGGNAWTGFWLSDRSFAVETREVLRSRAKNFGAGPQILIALSRVGPPVPTGVQKLMREAPKDWCFWARMHPVGQEGRWGPTAMALRETTANHAPLEEATVTPLPALLQIIDANVTVGWSTVIEEAAAMGIPSFATDPNAAVLFSRLLETGQLTMLSNWEEASPSIRAALARRQRVVAPPIAEMASRAMRPLLRS